jgi:hypothetical protein
MSATPKQRAARAARSRELPPIEHLPLFAGPQGGWKAPTAAQVGESERRAERRFLADPEPLTGFGGLR